LARGLAGVLTGMRCYLRVGTGVHEASSILFRATQRRIRQRCPSIWIARVDVGTRHDQLTGDSWMPSNRFHQWGNPEWWARRIDVLSFGDESKRCCFVTSGHRRVELCGPTLCATHDKQAGHKRNGRPAIHFTIPRPGQEERTIRPLDAKTLKLPAHNEVSISARRR
jgi:hypothetical protein